MAAQNLDLAADANDTAIAFDVPKHLTPYAREFYQVRKREGETIEKFMCRHVCEAAVHWKAGALSQAIAQTNSDATISDGGEIAEQASTLLAK